MAFDDRLYDLVVAPDHRFHVYSSANSYIAPYTSDTHGGELITEFNQRASLNTLLARNVDLATYSDTVASAINDFVGEPTEIDSTTGETVKSGPGLNSFKNPLMRERENWHFISYASGTRSMEDFELSIDDATGKLSVAAGQALVYGYFIQGAEVLIEKSDIINVSEIADVQHTEGQNPDNPCITKFIKLAVEYTSPAASRHDERLIPPLNGVYQAAAIVVNNELPYGNELLLGTVTCDSEGRFLLVQNPYKTRIIPLTGVQGAEDYSNLISAPDDSHIYGVKAGEPNNLIDIDKWIWIAFNSNLGRFLRSMSTNADTAGNADDEPTRGVIVSDRVPYTADDPVVDEFNCLQRVDAKTGDSFARMSWHQAQTPPRMGADLIDHRALYFQYAMSGATGSSLQFEKKVPLKDRAVAKPFYDINSYPCLNGLNGTDGIMTYQQLAMLELVFDDYIHRQADGYARGRQYGPFLTLEDAATWFEKHKPRIRLGDYFWVINDVAEAGGTEANVTSTGYELHNIVTNYGTVSGTVTGTAKQSKLEAKVSGTVTGETEPIEGISYLIEGEVNGTAQGTINASVSGSCNGTLDSFTQNVSGRYVCRYYKAMDAGQTGRWDFAHAVMLEEQRIVTQFTSNHIAPNIRPGSLLIVPAEGHPVETEDAGDVQTAIIDDGYGRLTTDDGTEVIQVGAIDYATGDITGVYNQTTAKLSYFLDEADSYVVLDPEGDYETFQDTDDDQNTAQSVLFALEAVERGFAVPATATSYGVVKTGSGSQPYDVIVDPTTQRLRITDLLLNLIKGGGFTAYPYAEITISPNVNLSEYSYRRYDEGVVFKMEGNASEWRAASSTTGTLAHIRGNVTLDFTEVIEDGKRSDGLLLNLVDIDHVTLLGDNLTTTTHISTESLLFGVDHCVVDRYFFTNIGSWKYSSFISGGDTLNLDLPWMLVTDLFTTTRESSLFCKFSSVTMGEEGICSAMMDVWVKDSGWEDYSGGIDRVWASAGYIKYPPMFFEYNKNEDGAQLSSINKHTVQYIPDNLNMKISGTAGVHQSWDDNNLGYVPSGNLLVNLNWEYNGNPTSASTPGGKLFLNLYMKNPSAEDVKQNFSNLRFRANVQVIRLDNNDMADFIPYEELYEPIQTRL